MNSIWKIWFLALLGVGFLAVALRAGDVALVDGQNAEDLLGQTDGAGDPVYTQGTPYGSFPLNGFNFPYDVAIDTAGHRLFISDYYSSRVLEFDLDSSNVLVDRTPDHVLGQTDFYSKANGLAANRLYYNSGIYFDGGSNRLFVADYSSHRVVIFDVASITDGENAVNVLGQADFTTAAAATTQSGMRNPLAVLFDSGSNRLFVGDTYNHRVLVFDLASITDGENAVNVLGQPDFTSGALATTQSGLYYPRALAYETSTARLFVGDYGNHRAMVFDLSSITDGENAINVLGQTTFTTRVAATSQSGLRYPYGSVFDQKTQRLFVADSFNHRVLAYDVASITDGENAVNVIGQPDFTSSGSATSQSGLYYPRGMAIDPGADRLFVAETYNYRATVFDISTNSITNGENASDVVGQSDGVGGPVYTTGYVYDGIAQKGFDWSMDVAIDTATHRLFVADLNGNRVLIYDLDQSNTLVDRTPDHVLGQMDFGVTVPLVTQNSVFGPSGLSYDPAGNRLFVSNYSAHRVMVFDVASVTDGENAVNVLGQANFTASTNATTQANLYYPIGLSFEAGTNRLFVADTYNHRVMLFDVAAISNGENAVNVIGKPDFTTGSYATTQSRMYYPRGAVSNGVDRLFVADTYNHRILVFDSTVITDGENAINVLGQTTFTTKTNAVTQNEMYFPSGVAFDPRLNRLFVADSSSDRVTVFDVASITDGENAVNVLGQADFTSSISATAQNRIHYPRGMIFDAGMNRLYIADEYNHRVIVHSVGPVAPSTSALTAVAGSQTGKINLSWSSAGDDGAFNNLTGNYRIQYATYTATWSTGSTPTNATTLTIATTSVTPGVVQSTTIAGLNTGTTYYFGLFTSDEIPNWSSVSNTASSMPPYTVTVAEAVGQAGWMGRGETQRILGTAQVVSDSSSGVTISSVAVQASGYTADGNLTNVEVWVSSSGYIDANAIRLENTAKAFSSNAAVFTQNVAVSTTPLYFIARSDVSGSATEGTFELALQVYTTAVTVNNPIAFSNGTEVVAPPSGSPSGLSATAASNLLQVNLSWGSATGADSYTIYRATHSGVTTTDFLLGITSGTSFADDYMLPAQQMYYTVVGTNRAGVSSASGAANATTVDIPSLTTSNIYLRAGVPGEFGDGAMAYSEKLNTPSSSYVDLAGNLYITDSSNYRIRFIPRRDGTYFGQAMTANSINTIAGNGTSGYLADDVAATSTRISVSKGLIVDAGGNLYFADSSNNRIRFIPKSGGTYFGQAMTANYIYTIAGNGTGGFLADDVAATSSRVSGPAGVTVDAAGNVYISDKSNHRIRFVPKSGGTYFGQAMTANYIYTIAGNGTGGYLADGVAATSTRINSPNAVIVDVGGNICLADKSNHRIRFIPKSGGTFFGQAMTANYIYTIAGNGTGGYLADGVAATSTRINFPDGLNIDGGGNLLIADYSNARIRFVPKSGGTYFGQAMTANFIYTIAGNGTSGYLADGVAAASTQISGPTGLSSDATGNVFFADSFNNRLRIILNTGGTYFGRGMTANYIYTIAGNGTSGYLADNVAANNTLINIPFGVTVDPAGNVYVADSANQRLRFIPKSGGTFFGQAMVANSIYTIAGNGTGGYVADDVAATSTRVNNPSRVTVDGAGNVYLADASNHRIRFIPKSGGTYFGQAMTANYIYTIAGNGTGGYLADGVAATSTRIYLPYGVSVDGGGNVYIAEYFNYRIRFVPKSGGTYFGQAMTANYIYTIAGNGTSGYLADGVAATSTRIVPYDVGVDYGGNVYIADSSNHRIRFVPQSGGTYFGQAMTENYIYTIAGNGTSGYLADNVAATSTRIYSPKGVNVDAGGNVFMADSSNNRIRLVPKVGGVYFGQTMTANFIYTIGGTGNTPYNGENSAAIGKNMNTPYGVFAGQDHMLYLSDSSNNKIRMIAGEDFIAPSTSTLAAVEGAVDGGVSLSWASAGDDWMYGNLTGDFRIQYATTAATAWSTGSTPSGAYTLTISTSNATPGVTQSTSVVVGLIQTWYFVIWTKDEVNNWSVISATASVVPFLTNRSVSITSGSSQAFGSMMMGDSVVGTTGTVVTNDGNVANTYAMKASTLTVGSPWVIKDNPPPGPDQLVIYGVFDGASAPVSGSFGAEDVIGNSNGDSSSTKFSVAGSTTGVAVPAGQDRTLWIRLDAPTTTTTVAPQSMKVEITAQPP